MRIVEPLNEKRIMEMKETYVKPEVELIDMETEGVIAASYDQFGISDDEHEGGPARSRRRDFWGSEDPGMDC